MSHLAFVGPSIDWELLAPLIILSLGGILLVTVTSLAPTLRTKGFPAAFTMMVSGLALASTFTVWDRFKAWNVQWQETASTSGNAVFDVERAIVGDALVVDGFSIFIWAMLCLTVFLSAGLLDSYLRREGLDGPEWYVLLLMSAAGGMLLAAAQELMLVFLGLEILSIAAYVLAALHLRRSTSQEAAFKYFILGAVSSAIFLYGIALVYGATGSLTLPTIAGSRFDNLAGINPLEESSMVLVGMALMLVGFAFKVSAVPFQMWTPDVYQGAPTPVVAFMASAVKVAGFAGLTRVFWDGFHYYYEDWRPVLVLMAAASMIVGSLLALPQKNMKRMLAYSSISHAGFILAAVSAIPQEDEFSSGPTGIFDLNPTSVDAAEAMLYYLVAYSLAAIGSFGVLTLLGRRGDDAHDLSDCRGLAKSQPLLAGLFAVLLFAQAGVPFTAGFLAKVRVILATASSGSYVLAGVAMLSAAVAAVLYLRIIVSMFMRDAEPADEESLSGASLSDIRIPKVAVVVIGFCAASILMLGIMPGLGEGILRVAAESVVTLS